MARKKIEQEIAVGSKAEYDGLLSRISTLLEQGRRSTVRATNAIVSATYWEVGRQIIEHEQGGKARAEYGEALLKRLGEDLSARFGRGFSRPNLQRMRTFFVDVHSHNDDRTGERGCLSFSGRERPENTRRCRHENLRQRSGSSIRIPGVGQGRPRWPSQRP